MNHLLRTTARGALLVAVSLCILWSTHAANVSALHRDPPRYFVFDLPSLGGAISEGRTINNWGLVTGFSDLPGGATRHAALWLGGLVHDLGTLGGPHSAVLFSNANDRGFIVGISETDEIDPHNEAFSCSEFFPGGRPGRTGKVCRGVVWAWGRRQALDTIDGGTHSFAAAANNRGQVVGWAQTAVPDSSCVGDAIFQFLPVRWSARTGRVERHLPLFDANDSVGTANAINDKGQVVGISGACDQAVGRGSAKHAVLWEHGTVTNLGNLGLEIWNTPLSINERGDVVGFAGALDDEGVVRLRAFSWRRGVGIRPLGTLRDHVHSEAWAINERRQIAGFSCDPAFADCRGVLWQDGLLTDLNELAPEDYRRHRHIRTARHINDLGWITGASVDRETGGERRAYVAVPLP